MKNRKAFTLTEILVVVFIVAILAAIPGVMFLQHTKRAMASEAVAVMTQIREGMRDYHIRHNAYFDIASGSLSAVPPNGVGVDVGVAQYFSGHAYSVDGTSPSSPRFATPAAVDFIISVNGASSVQCGNANCALNRSKITGFRLEMDNTGRIFASYDGGASWQQY